MQEKWGFRTGLLLVAVAVLGIYLQTAQFDFVLYDDNLYITENPALAEGLTPRSAWWAFTTSHGAIWAPLMWLSHALDVTLFGMQPGGHHLVSVLWHVINTVLVGVVFSRITGRVWASLAIAALFGLHPLRVESVAWVAERKDVLSAFFALLCLWAYDRYARSKNDNWYIGAVLFFALGLMAKPMLVTLPCVLLLLDWWPYARNRNEPWWKLVAEKAPFFILTVFACWITVQAQQPAIVSMETVPFWPRVAGMIRNYFGYAQKSLLPYPLATPYVLLPSYLLTPEILGKGTAMAFLTGGAWMLRTRAPYVLVGWLWFLGMLVPVIGLVQIGHHAMADRFSYLPHLGLGMAAVLGIGDLLRRWPRAAGALAVALAGVYGVLTFHQIKIWRNSETLFSHALRYAPNNYIAYNNLAEYCMREGRYPEAIEYYQQTLQLDPNNGLTRYNYGSVLVAAGEYARGIEVLRAVEPEFPEDAGLQVNLAAACLSLGQLEEAENRARQALLFEPGMPKALECLAMIEEAERARGAPSG